MPPVIPKPLLFSLKICKVWKLVLWMRFAIPSTPIGPKALSLKSSSTKLAPASIIPAPKWVWKKKWWTVGRRINWFVTKKHYQSGGNFFFCAACEHIFPKCSFEFRMFSQTFSDLFSRIDANSIAVQVQIYKIFAFVNFFADWQSWRNTPDEYKVNIQNQSKDFTNPNLQYSISMIFLESSVLVLQHENSEVDWSTRLNHFHVSTYLLRMNSITPLVQIVE